MANNVVKHVLMTYTVIECTNYNIQRFRALKDQKKREEER